MRVQDTYKEVKTFVFPNMTVNVYIPDLTEEERNRRMKKIHKSAANLIMKAEEVKRNNEKN